MGLVKTYSFPCLPLKREPGKRQSEGQQADQVQGFEMYLKDLCKAFLLDEGRDALKRALVINIKALFQFFCQGTPLALSQSAGRSKNNSAVVVAAGLR